MQPLCVSEDPGATANKAFSGSVAPAIRLIPGRALNSEQIACWRLLQEGNPDLDSPCFAPDFIEAVASVRDDVEVALIKGGDDIHAFFPFQRRAGSRAVPVGGLVSDYQGLICRPSFSCNPRQLLKDCNLVNWKFDRLLCSQQFFIPYYKQCTLSARIDISAGYGPYVAQRRAAGTHQIKQCEYMIRRMERDLGALCFVPHSSDPQFLSKVLAWKSEQYRRTGWSDLFATDWGRSLVERIHETQRGSFGGMLSLLFAGRQLVAGHFGMRSKTVWHYWFPAYDRRFARYSPGLILLLKMARFAEDLGLRRIDIGTGLTLYKRRLMNSAVSVAEGSLEMPNCRGLVRSMRSRLKRVLKR